MKTKNFQNFMQIVEYIIKYFKWVVLFAVILMALSGVYRVESSEVAVVLRLGGLTGRAAEDRIKKPGLHFAFPFFIDEIIKIPAHMIHEKEITTHYGTGAGLISENIERSGYVITGDNNVALLRAKVIYRIDDAAQYALFCSDAESVIDGIVSGEIIAAVTHMGIDSVLTSGRAEIASKVLKNSQAVLDGLNLGVVVSSVELPDIIPPAATLQYFEEVRSAAVTRETNIQKAKERASAVLLDAQAASRGAKQTAISEQSARLAKVRDELAEFNGLYGQYAANPKIITDGTFRQRAAALLAKAGGSIIVPEGEPPVIILP